MACWGQTSDDYIFLASGRLREDIDELVPGGGHEHVVADEVAGWADLGEPELWSLGEVERGSGQRCWGPERGAWSSSDWVAYRYQSVSEQRWAYLAGPEPIPGDAGCSAGHHRDRRQEGLVIKRRVGRGVAARWR